MTIPSTPTVDALDRDVAAILGIDADFPSVVARPTRRSRPVRSLGAIAAVGVGALTFAVWKSPVFHAPTPPSSQQRPASVERPPRPNIAVLPPVATDTVRIADARASERAAVKSGARRSPAVLARERKRPLASLAVAKAKHAQHDGRSPAQELQDADRRTQVASAEAQSAFMTRAPTTLSANATSPAIDTVRLRPANRIEAIDAIRALRFK